MGIRVTLKPEFQITPPHWIKDQKFSTRVKDEESFPSFALVNKATGQAMKHSIDATHPVNQGLTVYRNKGSTDQSAGTRSTLYANWRESVTVAMQEVTPRSVGALIALYEKAVGIYASFVNINEYHQPGVEAGKKAAGEVLPLHKRALAVLNEARLRE